MLTVYWNNYEARADKIKLYEGELYQELGVVHFVTVPEHRKQGYASLVAGVMYKDVIKPLLTRHVNADANVYVIATKKAAALMQNTGLSASNLVTQFYSELSFKQKVVEVINPS